MPKKSAKKEINLLKSPIIIIGVAFIAVIVGYFGYQKFLDWQNKNFIIGMAEDYPALLAEVEKSIDYPLDISSDCMQTREKFTEGVGVCQVIVGLGEEKSDAIDFSSVIKIYDSSNFNQRDKFDNDEGYTYSYMNKNACEFSIKRRLYASCVFGVRDANKQLASDLFSEEALNARKNELLNK